MTIVQKLNVIGKKSDDNTFDGVWITAVLEHVIEPQVVVDEI